MSTSPLGKAPARGVLVAAGLLVTVARGAELPPGEVPAHPLVLATEALYQGKLPRACDDVLKLAAASPGLTDDDLVRVQLMTAMRALDEGKEPAARRALSQALQVDRSAQAPPYATQQLRAMLEKVRRSLPSSAPSPGKESRLAAARKAAATREPAPRALLGAVDALYTDLQIDGAGVVLDLARASTPQTAADRAQVALRSGILKMEGGEEADARAAFREALQADPGVHLPDYAPPKTLRLFQEVTRASGVATVTPKLPPVQAVAPAPSRSLAPGDSQRWGLITGGAGAALVVAGAVAGVVALQAYHGEQRASASGDYSAYLASRSTSKTAIVVSNCLYGVGAAGVGVGAVLFFRVPDRLFAVGAGAGSGRASVLVSGSF
jgi:hypothetical protein